MVSQKIIIEIDKITSGKNNVISFERKGRQVNQAPLKLKPQSESSNYHYNHHFDKDDLETLSNRYPSIYPNPTEKNVNNWADEMKKVFQYLIETQQFDKIYDYNGEQIEVNFIWKQVE